MTQLTFFTQEEWYGVLDNAIQLWKKQRSLLKEPGRKEAEKSLGIRFQIHPYDWIAIPLLLAVVVFTGMKAAIHAAPVADHMYTELAGGVPVQYLIWLPRWAFVLFNQIMFVIASEMGLIYFALVAEVTKFGTPERSGLLGWLSFLSNINTWMKALPLLTVYGILAFVIQVSAVTGVRVIDWALVIVMGLGLAQAVKRVTRDYMRHRENVTQRLESVRSRYEAQLAGMWQDVEFLTILADHIFEALHKLERTELGSRHKKTYPNAWLSELDGRQREVVIVRTFNRFTAAQRFAKNMANGVQSESEEPKDEPESEPDVVESKPTVKIRPVMERLEAPDGGWWDADSLALSMYEKGWEDVDADELKRRYKKVHSSTIEKARTKVKAGQV